MARKDKVVFTSAVCDTPHLGHLRMFEQASKLGKLIVAIPSSDSNISFKGHPTINTMEERLRVVQALEPVYLCIAYHSLEELKKLIYTIKPDIVCRGDDQVDFNGKKEAQEMGARIVYFPYSKDISSTEIRRRCQAL